jgi:sulfur-oxidizing protein SoxY
MGLTRRDVLMAGCSSGAVFACAFLATPDVSAGDQVMDFVGQLAGGTLIPSDRVHLIMPAKFPTGYTVPLELEVDSPMTKDDHVRRVRVFAPENPLIEVAGFNFVPQRSVAHVSTRVRLAKPQYVVAVAEMNDGRLLAATTWVDVASNGCA